MTEWLKTLLVCVLLSWIFGVAYVCLGSFCCVEYFTIRYDRVDSLSSAISALALDLGPRIALPYGVVFGVALATAARLGNRSRVSLKALLISLVIVFVATATVSLICGGLGYWLADHGRIWLIGKRLHRIPLTVQSLCLALLFAEKGMLITALFGMAIVLFQTCRRRGIVFARPIGGLAANLSPGRFGWFRFSLRQFLMLTATLAVAFGFIGRHVRMISLDAMATAELRRLGGQVELVGFTHTDVELDFHYLQLAENVALFAGPGDREQLAWLPHLTHVKELGLRGFALTSDDVAKLATLKQLRSLSLYACSVPNESLGELTRLDRLRNLDLSCTDVSDIGLLKLSNMKSLRWLGLKETLVSETAVARLKGATHVDWQPSPSQPHRDAAMRIGRTGGVGKSNGTYGAWVGTSALTESALESLKSLEELTRLTMFDCDVTVAHIRHLQAIPTLDRLTFQNCRLTAETVQAIGELHALQTLRFLDCKLADARVTHLRTMTSLVALEIINSPITIRDLADIAGLSQLRELSLCYFTIPDDSLKHLSKLKELQSLNLAGTTVGDDGIRYLADLLQLQRLNLTATKISDASVSQLARLPSIRWLSIGRTSLTHEGARQLRDAIPGVELDGENWLGTAPPPAEPTPTQPSIPPVEANPQ